MASTFLVKWFLATFYLVHFIYCCPDDLASLCKCEEKPNGMWLSCENVNFDDLTLALVASPATIDKLKIRHSNMPTLENLSMTMFNVKKLDLSNNNIEKVEEEAFGVDAAHIVELKMANNSLTTVPQLKWLTSLEKLDVSGNSLTDLEEQRFITNSKLRVLKASSNKICSLSPNSIAELKESLESLDLSKNCFTQVPAQNIRGAQRLKTLDLSNNNIDSVQNLQFMNMPELQELYLMDNSIGEIMPLAFMNLPKLENLNISNNHIRNLDTTRFQSFENLQLLDLSKNQLEKLPASAFKDFAKLKELHLVNNRISTIETMAISNAPQLTLVNLANNDIRTLYRNAFDALPQMTTLFLQNNKLQVLEEGMLSGMSNLQQLSLRANELWKIEKNALSGTRLLSTVDLGQNKISDIPNDLFQKMKHLFWLDLSDNQLATIANGTFGEKIANLLLYNNPLHCDETLNWLVTYISLEKVRTNFPGQPDIVCKSPTSMAGKSLKSLVISKMNETMILEEQNAIKDDQLIRSLIGSKTSGGQGDSSGIFPTLDKLTDPLTRLLQSRKGSNNLADFIKRLKEILTDVQNTGPLKNVSPELINYVLKGGQIPGVPPNMLKRFVENYARSLVNNEDSSDNLPQLSSLPVELVEDVMRGKPVLGLTEEETVHLRERYLKQVIGPNSTLGTLTALLPKGLKSPLSNLTKGGTLMGLTLKDLDKIDLSQLPVSFLTDIMIGKTPDINQVPLEIVRFIVERNPTFFGELVGQQLNKTAVNTMRKKKTEGDGAASNGVPYDVSHLDKKGNLKMFDEQAEPRFDSGLVTGIALGVVAMLTVLTIFILCYRRMKKSRSNLSERNNSTYDAPPTPTERDSIGPVKSAHSFASKSGEHNFQQPIRCYAGNGDRYANGLPSTRRETKDSGINV